MIYPTSIIDSNEIEYNIPCYEIGNFSKNVINNYINESEKNKKEFDEFKKNYNSFDPSFDFMITKLNYKIKNIFLLEETIMYGKDNFIYDETLDEDKVVRKYQVCNDDNFMINHIDIDNLKSAVINNEGHQVYVDRNKELTHDKIFELLLVHELIFNKDFYEDYIRCRTNLEYKDIYYNISSYFINRLGFMKSVIYEDKTGYILLNKQLENSYVKNLLLSINEFYKNIQMEYYNISNNYYEEAIKVQEKIGDSNEYRRI